MKMHESAENYLETILILRKRNGNVRSIDIANELDYSKPSISRAVKLLRENGYIIVDDSGLISLTDAGEQVAESMYERHTLLTGYLTSIGVDSETAAEDACRIEHVISQESFEKIRSYAKNHTDNLKD